MSRDADALRAIELLEDLIAIPSVNPRLGVTDGGETEVAAYVDHWAREHGWAARMEDVLPGRANVYVTVPGELPGTILLQTHTDTVEVGGMTVLPFELGRTAAHHRVTGRGVCDAKGQLALFMTAVENVSRGSRPHHGVVIAACIDEEERYRGVTALCDELPACIGAIVGEPTSLRLVVAQKGVLRCRISVRGTGGHSSRPDAQLNPIYSCAEIISYIANDVAGALRDRVHPLLGAGTIAVTTMRGGEGVNLIPTEASLEIDQRTLPADDPLELWRVLKADIEGRWPAAEVGPPSLIDHGMDADADSPYVHSVQRSLRAAGLDPSPIGVPFGSDASKLSRAGIPTVVFGAGSIEQAHTKDEFVEISQLSSGVRFIEALLSDGELS
ncbi:M20/M25/M40 family metallo-hydrolase [Kribbella solani]|uniref:M20/M25/M40 family metallo-hydrolase n=1 Tax=Kribbella solani TaxID=236067 RepID=UPI0029BDEAFA|nr:M20/M25/M40 family metallo-hydrolase [Kribbella solani]MDX2968624.1 M20/M25/M40 family metallo-hydrolase [Kribbella solani]MDX3006626.1 M20/M25/M40 family metallo-hydrolase [Kribbella solani]